jgi:hypothetical protein
LLDNDDPALFPKLTDEQLDLLAKYGQVRSTGIGEILFRDGDATHDAMVLLEGCVTVVIGSGDTERELAIVRTQPDRRRSLLLRSDGAYTSWFARTASSAWSDTCATALSGTPTLRFHSVMKSENSMVTASWSKLSSKTPARASAGL